MIGLRKMFRKMLTCKHLERHKVKYDNYSICRRKEMEGAINPNLYGQCKHCKYWE